MRWQLIVTAALCSVVVDARKLRGISLSYKRFYRERKSFLCIDGSKMIPFEQVNDDFCDCDDGSDEPGTAACPNGRFYCSNLGFRPHYIPSSRVNDGICDCCDASDEYNSHARCPNSCRSLGRRERLDVAGQMKTLDEGLRLKQQLIEEGVLLWRDKQAQLRELQQVAAELQTKMEEQRRRRREAELLKERVVKAAEERNDPRGRNGTATHVFQVLDGNNDGSVTLDEVRAKVALVRERDGVQDRERDRVQDGVQGWVLSEDEALVLLGGVHQVDLAGFRTSLWTRLREGDGIKIRGWHGIPGGLAEDEDEDPNIKAAESAAEKEAADLKKVEEAFETASMEISDLKTKLTIDYGPDWEFLFLSSQCYQLQVYEYTYTLCPFQQLSQRSQAGAEVLLGKWGTWEETPGKEYSQMRYESGEPCWQGPTRNVLVTLSCGTETALRSVKEPSKCQYEVELQTPVACQPLVKQQGVHSEL